MKKTNNMKTKKIRGTDLGAQYFLVADQPLPKFWLLPICDPTSRAKTVVLIQRNLDHWDEIKRRIPLDKLQSVRAQLEGAAMSYGLNFVPEIVNLTEDEAMLCAETFADRMLALIELDSLYDFSMDALT